MLSIVVSLTVVVMASISSVRVVAMIMVATVPMLVSLSTMFLKSRAVTSFMMTTHLLRCSRVVLFKVVLPLSILGLFLFALQDSGLVK